MRLVPVGGGPRVDRGARARAGVPQRVPADPDLQDDGFARRAGVADLEKFDADMRSVEVAAEISRDLADARRLGAPNSVPLFLIGNEAISGAQPTEVFVQAVERQAATAQ